MFNKVLIANRGEIACRVMATARRLGIGTVAIYSDADRQARHVAMADEAVWVGGAPAVESYLQIERILDAAVLTGADAIHPGYGFLAEKPEFVEAVVASGFTFIGPPASAIRAMGLKDAAKKLMDEAGVPVVPGYHGGDQDSATLADEADRIGYPVLIKARAGGGGKGMRLVERAEDFVAALEGARREGQASFGDSACLIERFITKPRHIEVQVFADSSGQVVHLFERDCSLQRRHQKVIEEAPAPDMPEEMRIAMGQAAVEAARAIGYQGAGTVEFIADRSQGLSKDRFWFMEMNTRLQVEHPVSEAITGLDFVELQLRLAAGELLPFAQDDLAIDGWAFEARIYAEDVPKGFLPATGRLAHLTFPKGRAFERGMVRVDSGVRAGDVISPHYDPMIAKLIVHGPDRAAALTLLEKALAETRVSGLVTNLDFLSALTRHEGFGRGEVDTGLIARDLDSLLWRQPVPEATIALACLIALDVLGKPEEPDPWVSLRGWRHWGEGDRPISLVSGGETLERRITFCRGDSFRIEGGNERLELMVEPGTGSAYDLTVNGHRTTLHAVRQGETISVFHGGTTDHFVIPDPLAATSDQDAEVNAIAAPMPGLVRVVSAEAGQAVRKGDPLIMLEAMKMEHTLTAPKNGVIDHVLTEVGAQVEAGALLIEIADDKADR